MAALGRLVTFAGERALEAQYRSQATLHALSQLAEVEAGSIALNSQGETELEDDTDYTWSMDAQQGQGPGLWNVTVRVYRRAQHGTVEVALSKLVLDPAAVGSTQDSVPVNSSTNNNASTGTGTGSSTTGSSTGM